MVNKKNSLIFALLFTCLGKTFSQISMDTIVSMAFYRYPIDFYSNGKFFNTTGVLYFIANFPNHAVKERDLSKNIKLVSVPSYQYRKWKQKDVEGNRMIMYIDNITYKNKSIQFYVTCSLLSIKKKEKILSPISENVIEATYNCDKEQWEYSYCYPY